MSSISENRDQAPYEPFIRNHLSQFKRIRSSLMSSDRLAKRKGRDRDKLSAGLSTPDWEEEPLRLLRGRSAALQGRTESVARLLLLCCFYLSQKTIGLNRKQMP